MPYVCLSRSACKGFSLLPYRTCTCTNMRYLEGVTVSLLDIHQAIYIHKYMCVVYHLKHTCIALHDFNWSWILQWAECVIKNAWRDVCYSTIDKLTVFKLVVGMPCGFVGACILFQSVQDSGEFQKKSAMRLLSSGNDLGMYIYNEMTGSSIWNVCIVFICKSH